MKTIIYTMIFLAGFFILTNKAIAQNNPNNGNGKDANKTMTPTPNPTTAPTSAPSPSMAPTTAPQPTEAVSTTPAPISPTPIEPTDVPVSETPIPTVKPTDIPVTPTMAPQPTIITEPYNNHAAEAQNTETEKSVYTKPYESPTPTPTPADAPAVLGTNDSNKPKTPITKVVHDIVSAPASFFAKGQSYPYYTESSLSNKSTAILVSIAFILLIAGLLFLKNERFGWQKNVRSTVYKYIENSPKTLGA